MTERYDPRTRLLNQVSHNNKFVERQSEFANDLRPRDFSVLVAVMISSIKGGKFLKFVPRKFVFIANSLWQGGRKFTEIQWHHTQRSRNNKNFCFFQLQNCNFFERRILWFLFSWEYEDCLMYEDRFTKFSEQWWPRKSASRSVAFWTFETYMIGFMCESSVKKIKMHLIL